MPHRISSGASAMGAMRQQPWASQQTQTHGVSHCISESVGGIARQNRQNGPQITRRFVTQYLIHCPLSPFVLKSSRLESLLMCWK